MGAQAGLQRFPGGRGLKQEPCNKTKDNNMKYVAISWCAMSALMVLTGCSSSKPVCTAPVGPPWNHLTISPVNAQETGFLRVYSATDPTPAPGGRIYHPHTPYTIYKPDGHPFDRIENSLDPMDEIPELVSLPAGSYRLECRAAGVGRVEVPTVVEPWRTTNVYLDGSTSDPFNRLGPTNSVALPDGHLVGWRATQSGP